MEGPHIKVQDYMDENRIGWCVEAHDLAASKLIAYREKDIGFVRVLLVEKLINASALMDRIKMIKTEKVLKERALNWLAHISDDF